MSVETIQDDKNAPISADEVVTNSLADNFFNDEPIQTQPIEQPKPQEQQQEQPKVDDKLIVENKPTEEPVSILKSKWGWDNEEVADAEIKSLREKAAKGFEWKDDNSKKVAEYINEGKVDDLYSFLNTQKKIEKLATADVTDKNVAAELVKFGLQKDNPSLNDDDVEFLFNEKYGVSSKPKQGDAELDEEYTERVEVWQSQVNNTEKRLMIEAKMNQPKMAQLKNELVLPSIQKENATPQMSAEDIAAFEASKTSFNQDAAKLIDAFTGFNANVKDKDVDYGVGYSLSKEEKDLVQSKLNQFSEDKFDANGLFADRWVNQDGKTLNIEQMVKDLSAIYSNEKATQKIANDAANKRMEEHLKSKKQIDVSGNESRGTFAPDGNKTKNEHLQEQFWGATN